jgi:hypothetical protein
MTTPQELLRRHGIAYVSTKKGRYTTACPNCGGGYLNVKITREGVVWFCHACKEGGSEKYEHRSRRDEELGPIKAIYPYHDEGGTLLFEVLRFEPLNAPKEFRQRRNAHQEKWSIKGVRRVLFCLPQLVEEIGLGKTIFVVEGEKDVLTLREHNVPATTKAMGAVTEATQAKGTGWIGGYSESLRGADVVLVCDNDDQGREHVRIVARCLHGIAGRIRMLDLAKFWPKIEPSDDITDWFTAGHTVEELWDIVAKLPDWKPPASGNGHDPALCSLVEVGRDVTPRNGGVALGLPELIIDGGDLTAAAKQLAQMFAKHRRFLSNGTEPIQIVHENGEMPRAVVVTPEAVRVFGHEICTPKKFSKKGEIIPATLSIDIANLYLRGLQGRWGIKPFNGITTAPILASDGSFRTGSGYDEATGLWCHDIPMIDVPEEPSGAQAKASFDALRQFFRTFAFADAETTRDQDLGVDVVDPSKPIGLDESCFLVSLMTAVCRASLVLAPGILATAPAFSGAGTGKGLAMKAICIIASGASPSAFTAGHDAEELDKRLTSALVEARPAIFLDNYNSKALTSDILASALTENPCEVRPMGHTTMVRLYTRTLVAMTGNAVQIGCAGSSRFTSTPRSRTRSCDPSSPASWTPYAGSA